MDTTFLGKAYFIDGLKNGFFIKKASGLVEAFLHKLDLGYLFNVLDSPIGQGWVF